MFYDEFFKRLSDYAKDKVIILVELERETRIITRTDYLSCFWVASDTVYKLPRRASDAVVHYIPILFTTDEAIHLTKRVFSQVKSRAYGAIRRQNGNKNRSSLWG